MKSKILGLTILIFASLPAYVSAAALSSIPVKPEHTRAPEVVKWKNENGQLVKNGLSRFLTLDQWNEYGGNLTSGDVDGDGQPEIIVGAAKGNQPFIRIFSADGRLERWFYAYNWGFKGGVRVAVADTDGDGSAEIITAPGPGAEAKIHIFNSKAVHQTGSGILAYDPKFKGGAHVTAADLNNDGKAEIITSPGPGGGPHVRVFDGQMQNLDLDFFAYDANMTDGVSLSVIQTPNGPNVVAAIESWSMPLVKTYSIDLISHTINQTAEFLAFGSESRNGVITAAFDFDHDGNDEIAATRNGGEWPEVRIFDRYGTFMTKAVIHDPAYRGALSLTQINEELAAMPTTPEITGPIQTEKSIEIDVSEQRLYAYEHGRIARSFLVSTGTYKYPTPYVTSTISEKIEKMDYRWTYGPGNPDNYSLPNVKFNLRFLSHHYIHYAYWHNNFGFRMSHGCVNTSLSDAEWIYNWADVGTPVEVHE
ncbi:MAG: L,D-transpeptidase family protein [Patescibacteria group bacterium]|nr:L,D-transpeptidase family protein [Patescibacteria group bacterium]MBU2509022.1 L,D-transpeptidase family protein [Patescibacteria group bacterium]